jgi:hypothetical protein
LSLGIDADQRAQLWSEINVSQDFWLNLKTCCTQEELSILDSLCHDQDFSVHFITSRCGIDPDSQTEQWLRLHGVCAESIIVVNSPKDKARMASVLNVQVAIDDHPDAVNGYVEAGIPHVYMLERKYNYGSVLHPSVKLVSSLIEFFFDDYLRWQAIAGQEAA